MSLNTAPWKSDDAYEQMVGTLFNYWACWTVYAVAHLSIADHLASGSLTAGQVATREGSAPHTTLRLMRAGAAVGLLTEDANERFGSTPLLETLRSDDPRSLRPFVLSQMASWLPARVQLSPGIDHLVGDVVAFQANDLHCISSRRVSNSLLPSL